MSEVRPRVKFYFTKQGGFFVFLCFLIYLAAINSGINLLYLLLASMLSLFGVSVFYSFWNVRGLELERELPSFGVCFQRCSFFSSLRNLGESPRFSLWLEEWVVGGGGVSRGEVLEVSPARHFCSILLGGEEFCKSFSFVPHRRGEWILERGVVFSHFPFAFFRVQREFSFSQRLLIYPPLYQVRVSHFRLVLGEEYARWLLASEVSEGQFRTLRRYQPSDPIRRIDWKGFARFQEPMTKEYDSFCQRSLIFCVDVRRDSYRDVEDFEKVLSLAASLAVFLIKNQWELALEVVLGGREGVLPLGRGKGHLHSILGQLALLELDVLPSRREGLHFSNLILRWGFSGRKLLGVEKTLTPSDAAVYLKSDFRVLN
ncbi:MAG: DUF58 domain-containing protein [Planctomycetota bacterium]|nr:MAG: DUF58 domain-containing protein [Planctomycetota bacterium]